MGSEIIFSRHIFVKSTTFCSVSTFYAIYAEVNSVKFLSNETDMFTIFIFNSCRIFFQGHPFSHQKCKEYAFIFVIINILLPSRATAFDFCKVKRGKDGGTLRTMSGEKLLKTLPVLQAQVIIEKFSIWFKGFFLFRLMLCWNLTVQPKTSTMVLSTAVSCCFLEI